MSGVQQVLFQNQRSFGPLPGQQAYTTAGTYTWVAPAGVTSVSVVVVGPGSNVLTDGTAGGALAYKNNITVVPGNSYAVKVTANTSIRSNFINDATVSAGNGPARTGDGGGDGGDQGRSGGGAGGYAGKGGNAATAANRAGNAGAGGGGGSGGTNSGDNAGAGGGGVGLLGQGSNGAGGSIGGGGGGGGSGGASGANTSGTSGGAGGAYGGGGGFNDNLTTGGAGAVGAVRIIWPGTTRSFPSTNTGNL